MEEQLIKLLLEDYKKRGLDLYAVLDDPLFTSLPLDKKLAAIKSHAAEIAEGTHATGTSKDYKPALIDGGLAGAFGASLGMKAAYDAVNTYFKNPGKDSLLPYAAVAGAGLLTGAAAGGLAYLRAKKIVDQRKEVLNTLKNVDNTDDSALKVLITRKNHGFTPVLGTKSQGVQLLKDRAGMVAKSVAMNTLPQLIVQRALDTNVNNASPYKDGVDTSDVQQGYNSSLANTFDFSVFK